MLLFYLNLSVALISLKGKAVIFTLTMEVLLDLPSTPRHNSDLTSYHSSLLPFLFHSYIPWRPRTQSHLRPLHLWLLARMTMWLTLTSPSGVSHTSTSQWALPSPHLKFQSHLNREASFFLSSFIIFFCSTHHYLTHFMFADVYLLLVWSRILLGQGYFTNLHNNWHLKYLLNKLITRYWKTKTNK